MPFQLVSILPEVTSEIIKKRKQFGMATTTVKTPPDVAVERMYQNYHPTSNFLFID